jgi:hypothetical protein
MNKILNASLVIAALTFAGFPASAQMTEESARASLVPFYKALNAANAGDAPETHQAIDHAGMGDLPRQ